MKYFKRNDGSFFMSEAISTDVADALGLVELSKSDYEKQEAEYEASREQSQATYQKETQAKALEQEAINEVVREQFADLIVARIKEKQEALTKRKNVK